MSPLIVTRREALVRLGGAGALVLGGAATVALAGCASPSPTPPPPDDPQEVGVLLGVELALIAHWQAVSDGVASGAVPSPGAAMAALVATSISHHRSHRDKWNGLLASLGRPRRTAPDPRLATDLAAELAQAQDAGAVLRSLARAETASAQALARAAGVFRDHRLTAVATQIAPVEGRHLAVIQLLAGADPIPAARINA